MLGGATQAMPLCIVEERQQRKRPLAAAPLRAAARRPAGFVARSLHTTPGIARRSRLASGPGGRQQSANVMLWRALSPRVVFVSKQSKWAGPGPAPPTLELRPGCPAISRFLDSSLAIGSEGASYRRWYGTADTRRFTRMASAMIGVHRRFRTLTAVAPVVKFDHFVNFVRT